MKKISITAYNLIKSALKEAFINVTFYEVVKEDDKRAEFNIACDSTGLLTADAARVLAREILAAAMVAETLNELGLVRDRNAADTLDTEEKYDEAKDMLTRYIKRQNIDAIKQLVMEL